MQSLTLPTQQSVNAQLERILASVPFSRSGRSRRFLRYVVDNSWEGCNGSLKEFSIAIHVFDRDSSYDPAVDATVRVEAGRLRSRLREYYADQGREDSLIIEIPKGAYHASFLERRSSEHDHTAHGHTTSTLAVSSFSAAPATREGLRTNFRGLAATLALAAIIGGAIFFRERLAD